MQHRTTADVLNEIEAVLGEKKTDIALKIDYALPLISLCHALASDGLCVHYNPYEHQCYIMTTARSLALKAAYNASEAARHRMLEAGAD